MFALLLILVTIILGIQVTETALFMVAEGLVNLLITADFGFRWKLAGRRKFFRGNSGKVRWWNWVDLCVVIVCNFMFVGACILPNKTVKEAVVEGFEETFLVLWCVFSLMRMVLIAKKHRLAQQNARTLINFENIVVDTDFGQMSQRSIRLEDNPDADEGLRGDGVAQAAGFKRMDASANRGAKRRKLPKNQHVEMENRGSRYALDDSTSPSPPPSALTA